MMSNLEEFMCFCSCLAIKYLCKNMSLRWVLDHQFQLLKTLLFVMLDLTDEVL